MDNAQSDMKRFLIKEVISMIQEQLLFEEILEILKEKGVDIEALFLDAYDKLGIDVGKRKSRNQSVCPVVDTESSLNSQQVNLLQQDNENMKKEKRKRKFFLDLDKVRAECSEEEDEEESDED